MKELIDIKKIEEALRIELIEQNGNIFKITERYIEQILENIRSVCAKYSTFL